jgi:formamidopyrimidine-DNA glycosylase
VPELPEVESARRVLVHALDREIAAVDDTDNWVVPPARAG